MALMFSLTLCYSKDSGLMYRCQDTNTFNSARVRCAPDTTKHAAIGGVLVAEGMLRRDAVKWRG